MPQRQNGGGFAYRGVGYDTGSTYSTFQGDLSRNVWNTELMEAEVGLVSDRLNANCITVYGSDFGRLTKTATAALDRGLHVRLDPRLANHGQDDVIDHIAEVARLAEALRAEGGDVSLTVGTEHSILTNGILPGDSYLERMATVYFDGDMRFGVRVGKPLTPQVIESITESAPRLNSFLGRAAAAARGAFGGELSYSGPSWEQVDWTPFDLVGIALFLNPAYLTPEQHLAALARYRVHGKPVLISGFGVGSYQGAEKKGFFNWDIVDRTQASPVVLDGYVRDEGAQAAYYRKMLGIFEEAGVHGVAPADLVHPTHPHSPDPKLDLDMASMSIVKSVRDDHFDHDSAYRRELKESFHAVAQYYGAASARAAA
jgi:hypothetical protein